MEASSTHLKHLFFRMDHFRTHSYFGGGAIFSVPDPNVDLGDEEYTDDDEEYTDDDLALLAVVFNRLSPEQVGQMTQSQISIHLYKEIKSHNEFTWHGKTASYVAPDACQKDSRSISAHYKTIADLATKYREARAKAAQQPAASAQGAGPGAGAGPEPPHKRRRTES